MGGSELLPQQLQFHAFALQLRREAGPVRLAIITREQTRAMEFDAARDNFEPFSRAAFVLQCLFIVSRPAARYRSSLVARELDRIAELLQPS
jgi:hypothetical protein